MSRFVITASLSAFFLVGLSHASIAGASRAILSANNQFAIDVPLKRLDYLESNGGTPLDSERGTIVGADLSVSAMTAPDMDLIYLYGHFGFVTGASQYVGAYAKGKYGDLVQDDGAQIFNEDFRIGKGFDFGSSFMATPFLGAGARQWSRYITGSGGYQEDYSLGYVGAGVMLQYALTDCMVISANGLVGETFNADMNSSLTPGGFPIFPQNY
jgi:hypothetical protein